MLEVVRLRDFTDNGGLPRFSLPDSPNELWLMYFGGLPRPLLLMLLSSVGVLASPMYPFLLDFGLPLGLGDVGVFSYIWSLKLLPGVGSWGDDVEKVRLLLAEKGIFKS